MNTLSSEFKKKLAKFLYGTFMMLFMTILTIFALFASDIRVAWLSLRIDFSFDVVETVLFVIFALEIILLCYAKDDYMWSFFFWLDIVATLSLIEDIGFIFDNILLIAVSSSSSFSGSETNSTITNSVKNSASAKKAVSKVSAASRATRVLRIIRIIRLIRIVKLYKSALMARANMEKKKKEKERYVAYQAMMEASSSDSSRSVTSKTMEVGTIMEGNAQTDVQGENIMSANQDGGVPGILMRLRDNSVHGSPDPLIKMKNLQSQEVSPRKSIHSKTHQCKYIFKNMFSKFGNI